MDSPLSLKQPIGRMNSQVRFIRFVVFTASTRAFFAKINLIYGLKIAEDDEEYRKDRKENYFAPSAYIFAFLRLIP